MRFKKLSIILVLASLILLALAGCSPRPELDPKISDFTLLRQFPHGTDNSRYDVEYTNGTDTIFVEFWYADRMPNMDDGQDIFYKLFYDASGSCKVHELKCETIEDLTIEGRTVKRAELPNPKYMGLFSWCGDLYISVSVPASLNTGIAKSFMGSMLKNCRR